MALVVAAFILRTLGQVGLQETGLALFVGLFWTAFVVALGAGTLLVADSISSEVREGTLGLLFLTDLKPIDVLAGKLTASSLTAAYCLLAILPILGLPMLFGGITGLDFLRASLALMLTLCWSMSLSLFLSTFRGGFQQVQTRSVAFTLLLAGGSPAAGGFLQMLLMEEGVDTATAEALAAPLFLLSPGSTLAYSMPRVFQASQSSYVLGVAALLTTTVGLLIATQYRLRHAWKDRPERAGRPGVLRRLWADVRSKTVTSGRARRDILDTIPYAWPTLRSRWTGWNPWIGCGVILISWTGLGLAIGPDFFGLPAWIALSILLHLFLKARLANDAQSSFFEPRRSGAIELLLTLPVEDRRHVKEHLDALRRTYFKLFLCVLLLDFGITVGVLSVESIGDGDSAGWLLTMIVRGGFLVLDSMALAYLGLWIGASTRKTQLRQEPFLVVVVGPWLVLLFLLVLGGAGAGLDYKGFLVMAVVVGGTFSLLALTYAKARLEREFRAAASLAPGTGSTPLPEPQTAPNAQSTGRTM